MQKMTPNESFDARDETLTGSINGFSVSSFIQILELEQKTCTLRVCFDGKNGCLYIKKGVVLDAETDRLRGEEAAITILGWDYPHIKLDNTCDQTKKVIRSSLTRLILEASKRKDESDSDDTEENKLKQGIRLAEAIE